ncbi:MAG: cysteine hydrolase [Deltaproteobacteria bacterium]|nr:cysteine hydrolase [Deltaproteobacteria bacterium]
MNIALILIDIQNDYFPGGKMELEGSPGAGLSAGKALSHFRKAGLHLVHIQHLSAHPGATFFVPGTKGVEIHESVKPTHDELVIQKHYPNAFRDTPLLGHLKDNGIESLIVGGMMTHMCVDASVRAAFDHGFRCAVLSDACATRGLSYGQLNIPAQFVHAAFLAALSPIYAKVLTVDEFLSQA